MAEILFKCSRCSQELATDGDVAGSTIECAGCGSRVAVAIPDVEWPCPACSAALSSSSALVGESFDCPSCGGPVTVPVNPEKDKPGIHLARKCPSCNAAVASDAVICVSCGHDFRSGKQHQSVVTPPAALPPPRPAAPSRGRQPLLTLGMLVVVLVAVGIAGHRAWRKKGDAGPAMAADALHSVTLPEFEFRHADLSDVLEFLNRAFREQAGPNGRIVRFVLAPPPAVAPGGTPPHVPQVTMSGQGMRLDQVLDLVAEATAHSYEASNNVVILRPGGKAPGARVRGNEADVAAMRRLLSSVLVPEVDFRQADIADVATSLGHAYRDASPTGRVASIVFIPPAGGRPDSTPLPRITLAATAIPLADALDAVAKLAGCSWTAEDNVAIIRCGARAVEGDEAIGNSNAQFALGEVYFNGLGVPANHSEAVRWYRRAADQGHPGAQFRMGQCCAQGRGVETNATGAALWWSKAASGSNANARTCLGLCLLEGRGVPQDRARGLQLLSASAEAGDDVAQYCLGRSRFDGGDSTNEQEALYWMERASESGNADARSLLSSAKRRLAQEALVLFGTSRNDAGCTNDPDLASVRKAVSKMNSRTAFPNRDECESLLDACERLAGRELRRDVSRAVIGSSLLFEHERDMMDEGLQRYGGVFMDKESIARCQESIAESRRQIADWQKRQYDDDTKMAGLRARMAAIGRMLPKRPRDSSPFDSTDARMVTRIDGTRSSAAGQHRNYLRWTAQVRRALDAVERESRKDATGGKRRRASDGSASPDGGGDPHGDGSSGSTTWSVVPAGTREYRDFMRDTFGGQVGVTCNAGEFGPLINPGGINW